MSLHDSLNEWLATAKAAAIDAFGHQVVALIHHGSTVEQLGDQPLSQSETIDLLLVLSTIDSGMLASLAELLADVTERSRFRWIVLTKAELFHSTDVLPDLFLEMRRRCEVIFGTNVLDEIDVRHDHLRLRCEQLFKILLIEMQQELIVGSNEIKQRLAIHFQTLVGLFGGALWLMGFTPPSDTQKLLELAAEQFHFRREVLDEVRETIASKDFSRPRNVEAQIKLLEIVRSTSVLIDAMADEVILIEGTEN